MKLKLGILIGALGLMTVTAFAALKSGLEPNAHPGAFQVVDVTGPNKGKQLCYRCQYASAPVVAMFVNGDPAKAENLVAELQKAVSARKDKGLKSFVVFMSGPESKDAIQKIADDKKTTIPLVFLPKGAKEDDIAAYQINPEVKNTVLLWRGMTVKNNFVDVDSSKMPDVEKALDTMLK